MGISTTNSSGSVRRPVFAPGLRVEIRDAEWVIRSVDPTSTGEHSLLVTGISELVRGKEARFLTELDPVKPLHPEDTELIPDRSALGPALNDQGGWPAEPPDRRY